MNVLPNGAGETAKPHPPHSFVPLNGCAARRSSPRSTPRTAGQHQPGSSGTRRSRRGCLKTGNQTTRSMGCVSFGNRVFSAAAPNQLWVTDLTFVPTWQGVAYVCFIIDALSRAIVGWRCASNMKTGTVLDAIEMARWSRGRHLPELVRGPAKPGSWKTVDDLELATLGWVHWHNTKRSRSGMRNPPVKCSERSMLRKGSLGTACALQTRGGTHRCEMSVASRRSWRRMGGMPIVCTPSDAP